MERTLLIKIIDPKVMEVLKEMEKNGRITILDNSPKEKLSEKYRGIISKEAGRDLNDHIKQMRSEWGNIQQ